MRTCTSTSNCVVCCSRVGRVSSETRLRRARQLRRELEEKLSEWRGRVLQVQSEAIERAEGRARAAMEARAARVASENSERARRHSARRDAVEAEAERGRSAARERIGAKGERVRRLLEQRQEERRGARLRASKMADLREGAVM